MPFPSNMDATWLDGSVSFNAQELRRADSALVIGEGTNPLGVAGGIVRHNDNSLAVTINASDLVTVQPGAVMIPGNSGTANGVYRTALPAAETGNLVARNATNPRIDLVVFRAMDTSVVAGHGAYTGRLEIIAGTPAASPVAPALPAMAVELARINVPIAGGGTATVDSTRRTFAAAIGGTLPVSTASQLPTAPNAKWTRAVTIDTGREYVWTGASWMPTPNEVRAWRDVATEMAFSNATTNTLMNNATERTALTTSFTKHLAGTLVIAELSCHVGFSSGLSQTCALGLRIGGTDYDIGRSGYLNATDYSTIAGERPLSGIGAGTYTVEPFIRADGASVFNISALYSYFSYSLREVFV